MAKISPLTSPAGRALFPRLTEPDYKFKEAGEYSVKLLLTEAEAAPLLEMCKELQQEAFNEEFTHMKADKPKMSEEKIKEKIPPLADLPVRPYEDPETGEETGEWQVTFKMTASGVSRKTNKPWTRRPALFDAHGKPISPESVEIWSGSILKVAYTTNPFITAAAGTGVSLRLEAVQIIELVSGGQRSAAGYGFDAEDGGYSHGPQSDSPFSGNDDVQDRIEDTGEADF